MSFIVQSYITMLFVVSHFVIAVYAQYRIMITPFVVLRRLFAPGHPLHRPLVHQQAHRQRRVHV